MLFRIFNFFYRWPMVFSKEKFCLLKFISKYFICCSYWIWDYFLHFLDCLLLVYGNAIDFYML